jgi:serine/threonine protein kinase
MSVPATGRPSSFTPATCSSSPATAAGSSTPVLEKQRPAHHRFKQSDFRYLQQLGTGTYGSVREARLVATNECVAIKGVHQLTNANGSSVAADHGVNSYLLREISYCRVLSPHPQIVEFLGIVPRPNGEYWLVFERLKSDLKSYLDNVQRLPNIRIVQQFTKEMLLGLAHCHARGIIHRDLKPANILLTNDLLHLKLADFGMARKLGGWSRFMSPGMVTLWYRAPELFSPAQENVVYTAAIDMWSAGCILAQLLIGEPLFSCRDGTDTAQYAAIHKVLPVSSEMYHEAFKITFQPPPHPRLAFDAYLLAHLPEASRLSAANLSAINLVTLLVDPDPLRRLTAEQALQHPFLLTEWNECMERPTSAPDLREMELQQQQLQHYLLEGSVDGSRAASSAAASAYVAPSSKTPGAVSQPSKKRSVDRLHSEGKTPREDVVWPLLNACHLESMSYIPRGSPSSTATESAPASARTTPAPIVLPASCATVAASAMTDRMALSSHDSPAKRQRSDQVHDTVAPCGC